MALGVLINPEVTGCPGLMWTSRKAWTLHKVTKQDIREHVFEAFCLWVGLHIVEMVLSNDSAEKIFVIEIFAALKSSLDHS